MLRSSHHPYHVPANPQPLEQIHVRNPWAEHRTSSSASSTGGRRVVGVIGPPPASEWLRPHSRRPHSHHSLTHQAPLLNHTAIHAVVPAGSLHPETPRSGSSLAESTTAALESCGGQCIACETFCYYCLQVVFIAGILTGTSLTIAGSVLRGNHRGSDLMVLVYIGVLLFLVCSLLLSVHCCVRRGVKARKRARARRAAAVIPLQELGPPPPQVEFDRRLYLTELPGPNRMHWDQQPYQPLIHRPNFR